MENNTNNRKRYTFLALNKCVSESGNPYIDITAELYLSGIQFKEVGGKSVCTARAAINNRQKILNNIIGMMGILLWSLKVNGNGLWQIIPLPLITKVLFS
jgi:hypothetical protein